MHSAINEIKNILEGTNSRIMETKDRISEVEDRMVEINVSQRKKEKIIKRNIDGNANPVCETAKETQMYRTVFWTLWEREVGMIWENGIETCIISYK